ncbi:MAG TPA: hypothetical protein VFA56_07745 [Gaiellaceae bacterium]|nr:hypothetical protein [Gaiellaceae bacterium]
MRLFGRREPLHERLAREGGLSPRDPRPPWQEVGIHGIQRPRDWDVTLTAEAPGIDGNAVRWVALPDGTLLVEDGPDSSLEALAAAVEERLPPPYRARAARQVRDVWAVQAAKLEVVALPDAPAGERIEVARTADTTSVLVDGQQAFGSLPALEARGEREGAAYAVHAERLDGDLFEITASAL